MTDPAPGFSLRGVARVRDGHRTLDGIDLDLDPTGITALVGRSGAGKSSLLRLLNRLDAPDEGTVSLGGTDLADMDACALRRRVAHVAQRPIPFDGTVADNLRVADPGLTDEQIHALLRPVGIADKVAQEASTLSGGEAQRMCIARALVSGPEIILADEPTSALDTDARDDIESLAQSIASAGVAWVWVSHDVDQTRRLADTAIVMEQGQVLAHGALADIDAHADARVRRALEG